MIARIKQAVERLRQFPALGSVVEEWNMPDIRELIVDKYRIIYRHEAENIRILTVIHGARRLPNVDSINGNTLSEPD